MMRGAQIRLAGGRKSGGGSGRGGGRSDAAPAAGAQRRAWESSFIDGNELNGVSK